MWKAVGGRVGNQEGTAHATYDTPFIYAELTRGVRGEKPQSIELLDLYSRDGFTFSRHLVPSASHSNRGIDSKQTLK